MNDYFDVDAWEEEFAVSIAKARMKTDHARHEFSLGLRYNRRDRHSINRRGRKVTRKMLRYHPPAAKREVKPFVNYPCFLPTLEAPLLIGDLLLVGNN